MVQDTTLAGTRARNYWQAQGIAELALGQFAAATEDGDRAGQRRAFYLLAGYYGRTCRIVQSALADRREPLAQAALRNLIALHRPLTQMHRTAPGAVPLALILDRAARDQFARDLIVRVLSESRESLREDAIAARVNELELLGTIVPGTVRRHLQYLEASGHAVRSDRGHARTGRTYAEIDLDSASLRAFLGPELSDRLAAAGFRGLSELEARPAAFRGHAAGEAGLSPATADLVLEAVATLLDTRPPTASAWRHADLLNSPYPRPYQYEAYAVFRGSGYQGHLVESPTGSGKTMIGMMCIQDWLRTLRPGQSILVLVPTSNYQQQWIGELCYKPIGLRLPPENVFAGTPTQLERFRRRTGSQPAIILLTYAALAQTGSGVGKGGFDVDSIETFLQAANVQYVALDEVHKVVEDMRSVSADVTRQLVEWLTDGSIRGLIGFSGTAEAYRPRFAQLGLKLAHSIPLEDLIGYGFVAPFVEFGVPFANSARERRIREILDQYKEHLQGYLRLLGGERLRGWFGETPLADRVAIARDLLRMYRGRSDAEAATARRLESWEHGGELGLAEAPLVTILQVARGWSDTDLAEQAQVDPARFEAIRQALEACRQELAALIYLPSTVARLQAPDFGARLDAAALLALPQEVSSATTRAERAEDLLATTIVGLYRTLSDWYLRAGEGRVETIKALIEAERGVRPVTGIIVFDSGKRLRWRTGVTAPGYDGVAGLFAQLLGDRRFTAFAALSSEMYLTFDEHDPLPPRIAAFIETEMMRGEVADAIFGLATQGLDLPPETVDALRQAFDELIGPYVASLTGIRGPRIGELRRRVLAPFRRQATKLIRGSTRERLRARLHPRNTHLADLLTTFFDYARLATSFRQAHVAEVEQVSGARERLFVVPMPSGRRKQLMYDLTARIVDAESLPVNLVIVSSWARTGWNVIKPNVLIDATATRDVTAWQQLRGRAMRALRTWSNDCYRLLLVLGSGRSQARAEHGDLAEDVLRIVEQTDGQGVSAERLEERLRAVLEAVAPRELRTRVRQDGLSDLTDDERARLMVALMRGRNKVTHIYELVKAYGSTRQVEYERQARAWRRRESIAHKHAYETAVDPFTGSVVRGVEHAPLLYRDDPRADLPADLQARVTDVIAGLDDSVVAGWLRGRES
jgi:superfamily II DNA or RNA helicase/predicted ArsR family transcriptional regulator